MPEVRLGDVEDSSSQYYEGYGKQPAVEESAVAVENSQVESLRARLVLQTHSLLCCYSLDQAVQQRHQRARSPKSSRGVSG